MGVVSASSASCSTSRSHHHHHHHHHHHRYDVFLSFRGEDTRKNFTDHLYTALVNAGLTTFRDDDEIQRGENIQSELKRAIEESRSSIIVFSRDYASSRWCLDELMMILDEQKNRRRTSSTSSRQRHVILPVFYDVDPSEVRKQTGSLEQSFAKHQQRFGNDQVKAWRESLKQVADLAGMVLKNQADGHESKFIQKVVRVIDDKLSRPVLIAGSHLIGMECRTKHINFWLQDRSTDANIMVICGMGGIGKTTIAKFVYDLNSERFEGSSFLSRIREISDQPNGLVDIQKLLLSDILRVRKVKIGSVDEGIIKIRNAICGKRVLIVLDDVDQRDQINAILEMRDWLCQGSKIIITTRRKHLLKAHELYHVYEVDELNYEESVKLFSWHAFGQEQPVEHFMEYSKRVVMHCGGVPLALKVLGSSFSGRKTADVWESALKKLDTIPDSEVIKKLKISFDSLQDDHDKNVFLDIACFFVGMDKDYTITILDGCDFSTAVGIDNLIDRCLLTIDWRDKLMMHQLLQDMARKFIIQQESPEEPEKRSRLWHSKDALNVLRDGTGTEKIKGLRLGFHVSTMKEDKPASIFFSESNSNSHHPENFIVKSALLYEVNPSRPRRLGFALMKPWFVSDEEYLQTTAFSRMHKLTVLLLDNVQLSGGYENFPKKLRWLRWRGFPLKSIPNEFPLESLVALDMQNSKLKQVWKGTKLLGFLKILDLSHSHDLTNTPDFSVVPNLEKLILEDCINLIEVHESIGELGKLVLLSLEGCNNLRKLPRKIAPMKSLQYIIISGCSNLDELPAEWGESLTELRADGIAINQLPSTTGEVESWRSSVWSWVSSNKPRKSPGSISFSLASLPRSLISLSLGNCNLADDDIPTIFDNLFRLQSLDLSKNPIFSLPKSIKGLTMLHSLELSNCSKLKSLPDLPMSLTRLIVLKCGSLEKVKNIPCPATSLYFEPFLSSIEEVEGLFKLEPIGNINIETICKFGLAGLESMGSLVVSYWNFFANTIGRKPLQGLYEFGILSVSLPGRNVPASLCMNTSSTEPERESSISIELPSSLLYTDGSKIQYFIICVVYACRILGLPQPPLITFNNKTKGLNWTYSPIFLGQPNDKKEDDIMTWLSHWNGNIACQLMDGGDQVTISVLSDTRIELKEFGVQVVLQQEEEEEEEEEEKGKTQQKNNTFSTYPSSSSSSFSKDNVIDGGGDLSAYQDSPGSYFLSNYFYSHSI